MTDMPELDPRENHKEWLTEHTFSLALTEVQSISQLPGHEMLTIFDLSVFDDVLGSEGSHSRVVGTINRISRIVGHEIEVASVSEPGVEFRIGNNGDTDRLLADVYFNKTDPSGSASLTGNIRFLGSKQIQVQGARSIEPRREDLSHEMWSFAQTLGLDSIWSEHSVEEMKLHQRFNRIASERMVRSIAKALKKLREDSTE